MGDKKSSNKSGVPLAVSVSIIMLLAAAYFTIPEFNAFIKEAYRVLTSENESRISSWVDGLGAWGPLFIMAAMVIQLFLFIVPSPLLMVIAVLAYGPFLGAALAVFSILLAATAGYWIGRGLGEATVYKIVGENTEKKIERYAEQYGLWVIVIARLSPILSNDAVSFAGGLLKIPFWKFLLATAAGITPLAAIMAYLGENNERLVTGSIIVTAVSAAGLVVYIIFDRRQQKQKKQNKE
jgi:uncharacterized membrane protein YdjX (TVP38/TMEM64 family)